MTRSRRRGLDIVAWLTAVVVVGVAMLVASEGVSSIEARLFHAINDAPDWLYRPA
jgi:hypothetical protein